MARRLAPDQKFCLVEKDRAANPQMVQEPLEVSGTPDFQASPTFSVVYGMPGDSYKVRFRSFWRLKTGG